MPTRERVIFNLDRFEWTGPGWLQVWGGWDGMDRRDLAEPTLVVRARGASQRLAPPPDGIRGGIRNWHAIFPWEDDPAAIEGAELELGGSLVVALPAPGSSAGRRRFGRTRLSVREVEPNTRPDVEDAPASKPASQSGPAPEADAVVVHVAVVAAREEAAEVREELKLARAAANRAAEDAESERMRRRSDADRLHEALDTLRKLAEESLQKERAVTHRLSAELDGYETVVKDERALTAGLRQQLQAASGELIENREIVEAARAEADGLRVRVEEVERDARQTSERAQAEVESLRSDLIESRQVAESWGGEADRLRAQLVQAERGAHEAGGEVERLRAHLEEAHESIEQSGGELEQLRARLEKAQRQADQSGAEAERLRTHLDGVQQQAQQSGAEAEQARVELEATRQRAEEADRLRTELEDLQRSAQESETEAQTLRRSLAAVREALQQSSTS